MIEKCSWIILKVKGNYKEALLRAFQQFWEYFHHRSAQITITIDIVNCDARCPVHILCEACRSEMNDTVSLHMFCSHLIHTAATSVIEEGGSTVQTTVEK